MTSTRRKAAVLSAPILGAFLLLGATAISRAASTAATEPESRTLTNAERSTLPDVPVGGVEATVTPCKLTGNNTCSGLPSNGKLFSDPAQARALAAWILTELGDDDDVWKTGSTSVARKRRGKGATAPSLAVTVLKDAHQVQLNALGNREIIVARIAANTPGAEDHLYGTTPNAKFEKFFYIVFDGWKPVEDATASDTTVGTYSVYGIKKKDGADPAKIVQVGKKRTFRWCKHPDHEGTKYDGARFMTCDYATKVQVMQSSKAWRAALGASGGSLLRAVEERLAGKRDATSIAAAVDALLRRQTQVQMTPPERRAAVEEASALIRSILADDEFSPAWMLCGGGCCTADF